MLKESDGSDHIFVSAQGLSVWEYSRLTGYSLNKVLIYRIREKVGCGGEFRWFMCSDSELIKSVVYVPSRRT